MSAVKDGLERIPCNMSTEDFLARYVVPRVPVMLTGCTIDWKAEGWTREDLLSRYEDEVLWDVDVHLDPGSAIPEFLMEDGDKDDYGLDSLSGKAILDLMGHNATVRVFDRVGLDPWALREGPPGDSKLDLISDWSWPPAMPRDLFSPTFASTDYKWVVLSDGGTGTDVHQDPQMTDAWNALLSGHKVGPP